MKPLILLLLVVLPAAAADTSYHKRIYREINAMAMSEASGQGKDHSGQVVRLKGGLRDGEVRKIVATGPDTTTEFYLVDERPVFVFVATRKVDGRPVQREERIYLEDGAIVEWLNTDKSAPVLHGEDYAAFAEALKRDAKAFVGALKNGGTKAGGTHSVEGTFVGIEEGDYFHWKMRSGGKESSYFIMSPDESVQRVLQDPEEYAGRKCRLRVRTSEELIPEAGEKMKVSQVLSVEWL